MTTTIETSPATAPSAPGLQVGEQYPAGEPGHEYGARPWYCSHCAVAYPHEHEPGCPFAANLSEYERRILVHEYHRQLRYGYTRLQIILCYRMEEYNGQWIDESALLVLVAKGLFAKRCGGPATYGQVDYCITAAGMEYGHNVYYHDCPGSCPAPVVADWR